MRLLVHLTKLNGTHRCLVLQMLLAITQKRGQVKLFLVVVIALNEHLFKDITVLHIQVLELFLIFLNVLELFIIVNTKRGLPSLRVETCMTDQY